MRSDPMCDKANGGEAVADQAVVVGSDGSLANVFVQLVGEFPSRPAPTEPVVVDQRKCIYTPRVVGVEAGQPLRVQNSDPGLHNVHGTPDDPDGFNIAQPLAGMVNTFRLKSEGILRLQCDVHTWMVAFVAVVSHPYFAVTNTTGTFELTGVPSGTYAIRAWHERYGELTAPVSVETGQVAGVEFAYGEANHPAAKP
jgi:plastocyanin